MEKIKAAVIGYGNIGRAVLEALSVSEDFVVTGVVRRNPSIPCPGLEKYRVAGDISELPGTQVAILAVPSRICEKTASELLAMGICTADSYDIHSGIPGTRSRLDAIARKSGASAVISAGWDPGSDSVIRTLMQAMAPKGVTYTNFGPGMSMGHTVAVKAVEGVKNALSVTVPAGTGIHRRMVYVELEDGYGLSEVSDAIRKDPYFINDETHVLQVGSVDELKDTGHGVNLVRKGVSGLTHNQLMEFNMKINNPALTGQILVSAARAAVRQAPGCYTMIEIPVVDFLPGNREDWIGRLV